MWITNFTITTSCNAYIGFAALYSTNITQRRALGGAPVPGATLWNRGPLAEYLTHHPKYGGGGPNSQGKRPGDTIIFVAVKNGENDMKYIIFCNERDKKIDMPRS